MNEEKLQNLFGTYGNVVSCKAWGSEVSVEALSRLLQVLPGEGRPDRAALVRFATVDEAAWVVENVVPARFLPVQSWRCSGLFLLTGEWHTPPRARDPGERSWAGM